MKLKQDKLMMSKSKS